MRSTDNRYCFHNARDLVFGNRLSKYVQTQFRLNVARLLNGFIFSTRKGCTAVILYNGMRLVPKMCIDAYAGKFFCICTPAEAIKLVARR